jgi:integrase
MASFRKRNGRWQAQVRRKGSNSISRTFNSKADARAWARMMEAKFDANEMPFNLRELKTLTLADLIKRYRDEVTPTKRSAEQETYRLNRLLKHKVSLLPLDRLSGNDFSTFRDSRLSEVGPQAVRHELNVLAHVLRIASREWNISLSSNPIDNIRKPVPPKSRDRRLELNEWDKIVQVCESSTAKCLLPLISIAIETAMRRMEMLNLDWAQIDLVSRTLHISETKNGCPRTIPLSPRALELFYLMAPSSSGLVFGISEITLRYHWKRLTRRAGIEDLHFHDLRHEAISRFFEKGLSIAEVALISGHKDVRQLFRYTHLRAEDVAKKLQ